MILFIEDKSIDYVSGVSQYALENNYAFKHIINGIDAYRFIKNNKDNIDVIIVDFFLPGLRGDKLIRRVREEIGFNGKILLTSISFKMLVSYFAVGQVDGLLSKTGVDNFVHILDIYLHKNTGTPILDGMYILHRGYGVLVHDKNSEKYMRLTPSEYRLLQTFKHSDDIKDFTGLIDKVVSCSTVHRLNKKLKKNNINFKLVCNKQKILLQKL